MKRKFPIKPSERRFPIKPPERRFPIKPLVQRDSDFKREMIQLEYMNRISTWDELRPIRERSLLRGRDVIPCEHHVNPYFQCAENPSPVPGNLRKWVEVIAVHAIDPEWVHTHIIMPNDEVCFDMLRTDFESLLTSSFSSPGFWG